jgi:hypothetical protein
MYLRTCVAACLAATCLSSFAEAPETNDPKILHAIGVMIQLKLKPADVSMVLVGTWQRSDQALSCVYYRKGKQEHVAIAAVGQVKIRSPKGKEQAQLCYPSIDSTVPVKYFAPGYL